jgi:hypothetical protein
MRSVTEIEKRIYFTLLYLCLILLIATNSIATLNGGMAGELTVLVQLLVLIAALARRAWSRYVVVAWAATCVIAAAALWLAVILRGSFSSPIGDVTFKSIMAFFAFYLILFARDMFPSRSATGASKSSDSEISK